jgi:uncharacterized protein YcfJ
VLFLILRNFEEFKMKILIPTTVISILLTTGCANMGRDQSVGTAIGGVGGAIIGSQFGHGASRLLGAGIGAAIGAAAGNVAGEHMDRNNQ